MDFICWLQITYMEGEDEWRRIGEGTREHCERIERAAHSRVTVPGKEGALVDKDGELVVEEIVVVRGQPGRVVQHARIYVADALDPLPQPNLTM